MTRSMLAALAATALALTGCSDGGPAKAGESDASYEVIHVDVDGRRVPCVVVGDVNGTGVAVTCDWGTP